jgi:UDP-2-acetamido-3-amino-2,3-dideoxy-glucuronate N-acetyltransferase
MSTSPPVERKDEYKPTLVKKGASIGANATIICGITIGEYAFIGAGAVVREDVPSRAVMVGVPAKRIAWMCDCGLRLPEPEKLALGMYAKCNTCQSDYWIRKTGARRTDDQ